MSEVTHTPLPWKAEEGAARGAWIMGADEGWSALACGDDDETAVANTAFILRACNSHYELLNACHKVVNNWGNLHHKDLMQLRDAIAKATA